MVYLLEGKGNVRQNAHVTSAAYQRILSNCLSEEWQQNLEYEVFDQGKNHLGFLFKGHNATDHFSEFSRRIANQVVERLGQNSFNETPFFMVSGITNGPLHRHIWQIQQTGNSGDPLQDLLDSADIILEQQLLEHTVDMQFFSENNFRNVQLRSPDGQNYGAVVIPATTYYVAENKRYIAKQRGTAPPSVVTLLAQPDTECDIAPPDQQIWNKSSEVIQEMWENLDRHTTDPLQIAVSEEPDTPQISEDQEIQVVDANKGETTTRKFVQELLDTLNEPDKPEVEIVTPPERTKQFQKKKVTSDPLHPRRIETSPRPGYTEDNDSGMGVILTAIVLGILALVILWFFNSANPVTEGCSGTAPHQHEILNQDDNSP